MATFTVTNTNNSGAGSLRQEILDANALSGKNTINFCGLFDDGLAHTISLTGSSLSITDDITIQGTNPNLLTIKDDSASRVFDIASGATATINGLTITNAYNSGTSSNTGATGGGGILNKGILTLNNSIITGNTVNALNLDSTRILDSGGRFYVSGNTSPAGDGAGIYNSGTLTVNYSSITANKSYNSHNAEGNGGGIYNSGILSVNYSSITDNSAIGDTTRNAGSAGGGIYNSGTLTLEGGNISNNNSVSSGGGIVSFGNGSLTLSNIIINGNTTGSTGGGIANSGKDMTVDYSTITDNTAGYDAGGIYNLGNGMTVNYSSITHNAAGGEGGGIESISSLTVNYSSITHNTAGGGGGGISSYGGLTVNYSSITDNTAYSDGGGIFNFGGSPVTVSYSSISGNTAAIAGGGIYNFSTRNFPLSVLTVSYSTISDNQAHFGAGIYNDGTLTVGNSTIKQNKAFGIELSSGSYESGDGGGIYNNSTYGGTTTADYSTITCNFDTSLEGSNNFISPDDIAGNFINNGYNWIGINTATTTAGDAAGA